MQQATKLRIGLAIILSVAIILGYYGCGGSSSSSDSGSSAVYEALGITDTDFGTLGVVTTTFTGTFSNIQQIARQSDGKLIGAGYASDSQNIFALVRYTSAGALDTIITTTIGSNARINDLIIQADNKILAVGVATISNDRFTLVRYNNNGTLDSSFGSSGITYTNISPQGSIAQAAALQTDNKIVAGGESNTAGQISFALARYNSDGSLDTGFGTAGVITTAIGTNAYLYDLCLQSDGKIVAAGYVYDGSDYVFALARYTSAGALDGTFGISGVVTHTIGTYSSHYDEIFGLTIQPDGKIIAAGWSYNNDLNETYGALARYTITGTLDTTFSTDGVVTLTIPAYANVEINDIALQSNGKIIVSGLTNDATEQVMLARYTATGDLDTTFGGGDGIIVAPLGTTAEADALIIQPDGYIVVGGYMNNHFLLARYK